MLVLSDYQPKGERLYTVVQGVLQKFTGGDLSLPYLKKIKTAKGDRFPFAFNITTNNK